MTTTNFNTRLMLALVASMVLGLIVLVTKANAADGAHLIRHLQMYVPYGL